MGARGPAGIGSDYVMSKELQFCKRKRVRKMDGGDVLNTIELYS